MSVETSLGITAEWAARVVEDRWTDWSAAFPELILASDADADADVLVWLRSASCEESGEMLLVLARLASDSGGNDVEAAGLLAWVMLPAACRIAGDVMRLLGDESVDHVVASQLWIEVRTFPWRTNRMVAGSISRNLRKQVLAELEVTHPGVIARRTRLVDEERLANLLDEHQHFTSAAGDQLNDLLTDAVAGGRIAESDRALVEELVAAAYAHPERTRPRHSLLAVSQWVAADRGLSPRHVRRLSRRVLNKLTTDVTDVDVNRPGMSGDFISWKDEVHGTSCEVSARVA